MENASVSRFDIEGLVIDTAIAGGIFLFFCFYVIPPHVPVTDTTWKLALSAYTSVCMGSFFWMLLRLFRVTLIDQLREKELRTAPVRTAATLLRYKP